MRLSHEAHTFFVGRGVSVETIPTGEALEHWNVLKGAAVDLFHVTG